MSTEVDLWPEGVARHVLGRTDSTMAEAARLAPYLTGPAWILAHEQTAGHGRRGRPWQMPPGNFAATLLFRPDATPATAALYSFVAALALDEALSQAVGPRARLAIKWPNDVLLNGGKVAGILLESVATAGQISHLAIGIGVNLAAAPDTADVEVGAVRPVSVLAETGLSITPEAFLSLLAQSFARFSAMIQTYGFAPIREAWLARAARIGEKITARTGRDTWTGIFETIDTTGAMILRSDDGAKVISAAEVFF